MAYSGCILGIKKMLRSFYLVVAVVLLNAACATSECAVHLPEAKARLGHGTVALTGKFLHVRGGPRLDEQVVVMLAAAAEAGRLAGQQGEAAVYLVSTNPEQNSVASAASLMIPLAQLTLWARNGPLQNDLLRVLNLKCKDEIKVVFRNLIAAYKDMPQVEFEVATKYYANKDYPLTNGFKSASKQYFDAGGEDIDYSQPQNAADTINTWVSHRTRGKIQDLVNPQMFSKATRLTLVNAIYFLGTWVNKFDPKDTTIRDFHKSNGEVVPVKMMFQQKTFNYAENEKYQVLEMFYKGNNFSFVVVLPRHKEDLLSTLQIVSQPMEWNNIMQRLRPERVDVHLPKMLIKTNIDLRPLLWNIGLGTMFNPSYGFKGVLQNNQPVSISSAVQQAYIKVDETGTEAAAATGMYRLNKTPITHIHVEKDE